MKDTKELWHITKLWLKNDSRPRFQQPEYSRLVR